MVKMNAITQERLREYQLLKNEQAQLFLKINRLREELLERLRAGAEVEDGHLTARVRHVPIRMLNGPKLVPLLGEAKVEELRRTVTPTVQVQLIVREREILGGQLLNAQRAQLPTATRQIPDSPWVVNDDNEGDSRFMPNIHDE